MTRLPKHGTQTRYKGARNGAYPPCRCDACKRAHRRACTTRALAHLAGTPPLYPGEPLREHIATLTTGGMSYDVIARRARVSHSTIRYLAIGRTQSCHRDKALRILAVVPGDFDAGAERPMAGTMRRIQALYALGHNPHTISAHSGIARSTISHIANGHHTIVRPGTAAAIVTAYKALSTRQGTSAKSRRLAKARGWHGPLAWDGNIDDPNAEPDVPPADDAPLRMKRDERAEERREEILLLATAGAGLHEIAARVGMSLNAVRNIRNEQRTGVKRPRSKPQASDKDAA